MSTLMNMSVPESIREQEKRPASPPPGPFGYSLMPTQDTPFEPAPALPPGPALLDDLESSMLDSFFTTMNESHFDSNDFWLGMDDKQGSAFNFEWPEELPPTFEGSTTSLPSFLPTQGIPQEEVIPNKGGPFSSDVLAAASMLYQNGAVANEPMSNFTNQFGGQTFAGNYAESPRTKRARLAPNPDPRAPALGLSHRRNPNLLNRGLHSTNMYFDAGVQASLDDQSSRKVEPLHWGSDAGFSSQRYEAPPDHPTEEDRTQSLLHNLQCFERQASAANTRPSSPVLRNPEQRQPEWMSSANAPDGKSLINNTASVAEEQARAKKRRKIKNPVKQENMETDRLDGASNSQPTKDRRPSSTQDGPSRKTKSTLGKPPRENLTEEQKRTNHILSEQKRRNLIKQGFEDLCSLVPELNGGGYSKSTMLGQAADWLEDLLRGNEALRARLAELKGGQNTTNTTR
ncbi:hypothetical protein AJ80_02416 [Polytolypa hystricis UAMH7299]|uniref:BHLH domain-containing protein n=1 Tax=Polytolypa hystricis (strain UAMH7299) TaxID=1447883 RepID=A0A2B7YR41_POLH7|nr:hypothetical protein AJ80_02416 [Polytolypa hystricis UAMH7299]